MHHPRAGLVEHHHAGAESVGQLPETTVVALEEIRGGRPVEAILNQSRETAVVVEGSGSCGRHRLAAAQAVSANRRVAQGGR